MSSNGSLLRKADIAIADLQTNGGVLSPEQGAAFIRKLIKQPTLIRVCRVVEMVAPIRKINKIGFGTRILRKATSAVALTRCRGGRRLGGRAAADDRADRAHDCRADRRSPHPIRRDGRQHRARNDREERTAEHRSCRPAPDDHRPDRRTRRARHGRARPARRHDLCQCVTPQTPTTRPTSASSTAGSRPPRPSATSMTRPAPSISQGDLQAGPEDHAVAVSAQQGRR